MVIRPINALDVLCAPLTRDLFAIAKFLFITIIVLKKPGQSGTEQTENIIIIIIIIIIMLY